MKEAASKLQPSPTEDKEMMTSEVEATKSTLDSVPIGNDEKRRWLLTLLSFHPEKKVTPTTNL